MNRPNDPATPLPGRPASRDFRPPPFAPAIRPRPSVAETIVRGTLAQAGIGIDGHQPWDLRVHDRRVYDRVLLAGTLGFGEAYMDGWWDCHALDEMCCRALRARLGDRFSLRPATLGSLVFGALFNPQSRRRAGVVGRRHYDLGNDFFAAMLDPAMQYSCGYFRDTADLATAQQAKMNLICRKLGLAPGMRVLDIGCGWGGLARHAAERHGCEVVGITISREQQAHAAHVCRDLPVEIRLQDYREIAEPFDRIVSVGMMEHVGARNYRTYLATAHRCLRAGGLFLCHTIGADRRSSHGDPWITRYIFPNSMLPAASQITRAAEGLLLLEDAQNFGADYDPTLLAWERNFRTAWPRFAGRYGERFRRMWEFYLLSCAGAFRARRLQLFQFVFSRGGTGGTYIAPR